MFICYQSIFFIKKVQQNELGDNGIEEGHTHTHTHTDLRMEESKHFTKQLSMFEQMFSHSHHIPGAIDTVSFL